MPALPNVPAVALMARPVAVIAAVLVRLIEFVDVPVVDRSTPVANAVLLPIAAPTLIEKVSRLVPPLLVAMIPVPTPFEVLLIVPAPLVVICAPLVLVEWMPVGATIAAWDWMLLLPPVASVRMPVTSALIDPPVISTKLPKKLLVLMPVSKPVIVDEPSRMLALTPVTALKPAMWVPLATNDWLWFEASNDT